MSWGVEVKNSGRVLPEFREKILRNYWFLRKVRLKMRIEITIFRTSKIFEFDLRS